MCIHVVCGAVPHVPFINKLCATNPFGSCQPIAPPPSAPAFRLPILAPYSSSTRIDSFLMLIKRRNAVDNLGLCHRPWVCVGEQHCGSRRGGSPPPSLLCRRHLFDRDGEKSRLFSSLLFSSRRGVASASAAATKGLDNGWASAAVYGSPRVLVV